MENDLINGDDVFDSLKEMYKAHQIKKEKLLKEEIDLKNLFLSSGYTLSVDEMELIPNSPVSVIFYSFAIPLDLLEGIELLELKYSEDEDEDEDGDWVPSENSGGIISEDPTENFNWVIEGYLRTTPNQVEILYSSLFSENEKELQKLNEILPFGVDLSLEDLKNGKISVEGKELSFTIEDNDLDFGKFYNGSGFSLKEYLESDLQKINCFSIQEFGLLPGFMKDKKVI